MKTHFARRAAGALLLLCALSLSARADDLRWDAFNDPTVYINPDEFAIAVRKLPAPDKDAALEKLRVALASPAQEVRIRAALALSDLDDKSGVPPMIAEFKAANANNRGYLAVILRILKDKRAAPILRAALEDKDAYVRNIALCALGEMGATEAFDDIAAHLGDRELEVGSCFPDPPAASAAYALGELGDRKAVPLLIAVLEEPNLASWLQSPLQSALQKLTGQDVGEDAAKWRAWWQAQPDAQ